VSNRYICLLSKILIQSFGLLKTIRCVRINPIENQSKA